MTKNNSINHYLVKSHEIDISLRDLFDERLTLLKLSDHQACKLLDVDKNSLNPLLDGTVKQPNMITVVKLAGFLELDIDDLLASMIKNLPVESIKKLDKVNKLSFITKHFDIDKLNKVGFIENKTDTDHIADRILDFFGFDSIQEYEEYDENLNAVVFSKTKRKFSDRIRNFAIKSAYRLFELIDNPNEYNREELKEIIPKIKPYCQDVDNGLYIVCRTLFNYGVTVVFQQHLTNTQYRGATFNCNNKPCIVLTDLNKKYPTIWFALLHELHHVLFDFEEISKAGFHLTNEPEIQFINEADADNFAQDFFFDEAQYRFITPHIHDEHLVKMQAKKWQIHPSFIYRGFQYFSSSLNDGEYWGAFQKHFPPIDRSVSKLKPITWKEDKTIPEIADMLKNIFDINKPYEERN